MQIPSQELMTKDNVTIHVDAVAFYKVEDPLKALCNIEDGEAAVNEAAQVCEYGWPSPRSWLKVDETDWNYDRPRCATSYLVQHLMKYYTSEMKPGGMSSLLYAS